MRDVALPPLRAALAVAALSVSAASGSPPVAVETHVDLRVTPLVAEQGRSKTAGSTQATDVGPATPGAVDLVIPWGSAKGGGSVTVHLAATMTSVTPEGDVVLRLEATSTAPGRPPVPASREIRLTDEGSGLFEVFGEGDRRILLTLQGERSARAIVRPPPEIGPPVRFGVTIQRVDGERAITLETDDLHTFVGQSVEYSFRQGQDDGLESVRLSLLPVAVTGDIITIDAEISGALPGPRGTELISRHERVVASRLASSAIEATTGKPPAGYRFQVTPDF
jgi:hypothetical protein